MISISPKKTFMGGLKVCIFSRAF